MSDLPEMMQGIIAQEHAEIMQAVWLSAEHKDKSKHCHTKHHDKDCTNEPILCDLSTGQDICTDGPTCPSQEIECPAEKKAAFRPALAGWSMPPELGIR